MALDPAFRLPSGGVALAGPVLDFSSSPAVAWLLSEDLALYALSEEGKLSARIDLTTEAEGGKPAPYLAVDPFGRVLVSPGGGKLVAYTRLGQAAWETPIEAVESSAEATASAAAYPPAFGSDGRAFVLSGKALICISPSGLRLWSLELPATASCPPAVDGSGRPCVGLSDGRILMTTPYGELSAIVPLGSVPSLLAPIVFPSGGGEGLACLAAGLADRRVVTIDSKGKLLASRPCVAQPQALAWDGIHLLGLDAGGEVFELSASLAPLWTAQTGCRGGKLYLFQERVVATGQGRAVSLSSSGEAFREMTVPGAVGSPAISPAGLAFCPGKDWVLAAYRFERPLGAARLPELPAYPLAPDPSPRLLLFDPFAAESGTQLTRLADIEKSLRSGSIGKDEPGAAAYCAAVVARAFDRDLSDIERRRRSNPLPRAKACYLLGDLGSPAYREPLFRALEGDPDDAVRAAACEALASIRVDPDGRSMAAFLAAAARQVDERTALVIIGAIEGMTLRSGSPPGVDGLRALVRLAGMPYGPSVRSRASAALGRISGTL